MQFNGVGAILGGGAGVRMGGRKSLVTLAGTPLVEHVARALRPTAARLAMVGDPDAARAIGAAALFDPPGFPAGPLSGVCAALDWAADAGADHVIVAPCDTPLLTPDVIATLVSAVASGAKIACAETADGLQPLISVWRSELGAWLRSELAGGHPPVHAVMAKAGAARVMFPDAAAFLNVNTPDVLQRAEVVLRSR